MVDKRTGTVSGQTAQRMFETNRPFVETKKGGGFWWSSGIKLFGDENKVIDHKQHMIVSKLKHKILPNCLQVRSFRASLGELKIRNMACLGLRGLNKLTCGSLRPQFLILESFHMSVCLTLSAPNTPYYVF